MRLLAGFGLAISLACAVSLKPAPAVADEVGTLMGGGEAHACFTRIYTKEHLAGHPDQNVRAMKMSLKDVASARLFELSLDVAFRGGGSPAGYITADCRPGEGNGYVLSCKARCGGDIDIKLRNADTVLVEIPDAVPLERGGSCDVQSNGGSAALNADDKVFRLSRSDLFTCLSLDDSSTTGDDMPPATALPGAAPNAKDPATQPGQ